jgi:NADP-reducing hydrogenase subunit HndB
VSGIRIEDLDKIKQDARRATFLREGAGRAKITVHMGTCGIAAGAKRIMAGFQEELERENIGGVLLTSSGCAGLCSREPMVTVERKGEPPVKYVDVTPEKIRTILTQHVLGGNAVEEYALAKGSERVY